jgi:hypothetical protein
MMLEQYRRIMPEMTSLEIGVLLSITENNHFRSCVGHRRLSERRYSVANE